MVKTTISNEDYLEAILLLEKDNKSVKSVEVAKKLEVSKPAVSIAMNDLIQKGLVTKESYGNINLTDAGRNVANSVLERHKIVKKVLIGIGVSEENADIECCKIEHILSNETLDCLKRVCEKNNF